jgi:hypothetical protein
LFDLQGGFFQEFVVFWGDQVCVRDLFCMIAATEFLAKALVLQGMDMGVVHLLPWYELVEGVGGVGWSSE